MVCIDTVARPGRTLRRGLGGGMRVPTLNWVSGRPRSRYGWAGRSWLVIAAAAAAVLVAVMQEPAGAAANPYAGGGYDAAAASAQCTTSTYPPGFAIIGVGTGRPFTTSACSAHEWSLAPANGTPATP